MEKPVEPARLLQPLPRRGVGPDGLDPLAQVPLPARQHLAAALYGLLPRLATPVAWGALAGCLLLDLLREFRRVSEPVADVSPFTHVPRLPAADLAVWPLVWLTLIAAGLSAVGLVALKRGDVG